MSNLFTDSLELDEDLRVGQSVIARWTNCGNYYAAPATISKINPKSVKVTLDEALEGYPEGWVITCPRAINVMVWSQNNGIFPVLAS